MSKKEKLSQLIEEGKILISESFIKSFLVKPSIMLSVLTNERSEAVYKEVSIVNNKAGNEWKENCISFLVYQLSEPKEKEKFESFFIKDKITDFDIPKIYIENALSHLKGLYEHYSFESEIEKAPKNISKIFISHASKDAGYIKLFVQLLNNIGIAKDGSKIFCSSIEGYGIPIDEPIYDYIGKQFNEGLWVIFALSKNYYKSAACLNEMGATWITKSKYTSVLLPGFEFQDMQGAIDATKISFFLNDKEKLNSFRNQIIEEFDLTPTDSSIWENDRDKFLFEVTQLIESNKQSTNDVEVLVEKHKNKRGQLELTLRLINSGGYPHELIECDFEILDSIGNIIQTININFEDFTLHPNENRREIRTIDYTGGKATDIRAIPNALPI